MNAVRVFITIILMIVTVYLYAAYGLLVAAPLIVITIAFFLISFTRVGAIGATRKIGRFTYGAIKEEGVKRIRRGTFHVDEKTFSDSVDKISDILGEQQYVPEFGIDGMFLNYSSEEKANEAMDIIKSRGLKADIIIDRRNWLVKVEFD